MYAVASAEPRTPVIVALGGASPAGAALAGAAGAAADEGAADGEEGGAAGGVAEGAEHAQKAENATRRGVARMRTCSASGAREASRYDPSALSVYTLPGGLLAVRVGGHPAIERASGA